MLKAVFKSVGVQEYNIKVRSESVKGLNYIGQ